MFAVLVDTATMPEEEQFDANVDYGVVSGYFVRLDIQDEGNPGSWAWVALNAGQARSLADLLIERAGRVDSLNDGKNLKDEPE